MRPIAKYDNQSGATLLEALIALGLMGIMMAMGARQLNGFQSQLKDQVASQHLKQVTDAAADYLRANAATVAATATPTTPAVITVADLIAGNFLPPSFRAQNPYNQTARVEVLEPTANELQALVLYTGGDTLTGVQAPAIAVRAGAAGGYVPSDNPTVAQGAYGGWQVSLSGYTNPGPNKLTAFLYFDNGNLANDYLYRHAVPGKPELNKMFTALDMGEQDINNAKVATAQQLRINGNNPGANWTDTDLVIGDASVNRHDSSLSIMSSTSALNLTASGDTLRMRQWAGQDIGEFQTNRVTTTGWGGHLSVMRPADTANYPMTVLSVGTEWTNQPRSLIALGANTANDMFTRIYSWSRTAAGVDAAATGNYLEIGETGNTYTPGNIIADRDGSFGTLWMNDFDAVLKTNAAAGQHDLIGTYDGWDTGAVYLAGYNAVNNANNVTDKVVVGGWGGPVPLYATGGVVLPTATIGGACTTPDALGLTSNKQLSTCVNGVWGAPGATLTPSYTSPTYDYPFNSGDANSTFLLGVDSADASSHTLCNIDHLKHDGDNGGWCTVYRDTSTQEWKLNIGKWMSGGIACRAQCYR